MDMFHIQIKLKLTWIYPTVNISQSILINQGGFKLYFNLLQPILINQGDFRVYFNLSQPILINEGGFKVYFNSDNRFETPELILVPEEIWNLGFYIQIKF